MNALGDRRRTVLTGAITLLTVHTAFAQTPTFSEHVAPIVFQYCSPCHRPNGSASFNLLNYEDARSRARQIVAVTASRVMPPWQPEPGYGEFVGERRLRDDQIAVLRRWVEQGAPEGDRSRLPAAPSWPSGWELGEPDLVLTMPSFLLRAAGPDMFRNFVLPVPTETGKYVKAWEFRPGNARVVHHATMQIDPSGASRRFDEQDSESGYEGLVAPSARAPDGFFLDWAPGHRPNIAVEGTAWALPKGADLVMMVHLRPSGKEEVVQASVGLYFSDRPPARQPLMLRLTRQHLDIPAGAQRYEVRDTYTLPVAVDLHTVQPHAHYLAREMRAYARLPDQTAKDLIFIKSWDFNWQDVYRYVTPIALPAGTTILMEYTYDNSGGNPHNPTRPPRRVRYGQQTSDEMAELWFQVVPRRPEDRAALQASLWAKTLPEEIIGHRTMLDADPKNVALRDDLALMLVDGGDLPGAAREFAESLRLRPESAAAQYNVGMALLAMGRREESRGYFDRALRIDPLHALAHDGLGRVLQAAGDLNAALIQYREASRLAPSNAEIQLSTGVALGLAGQRRDAILSLRRALLVRPDWAHAEAALAWVLAVSPEATPEEGAEAVRLAGAAADGTQHRNAAFLDILATALASIGEFDRAIAAARAALALAAAGSDASQVTAIRQRLALFEQRTAYKEGR